MTSRDRVAQWYAPGSAGDDSATREVARRGAILVALLSSVAVTLVTHLWTLPLHVPFQYAHAPSDDEQDATLDMMLIKNISETGWFDTNPKLNAPFAQHWAEGCSRRGNVDVALIRW